MFHIDGALYARLLSRVRDRFDRIYRDGRDAWSGVRLYPETVAALDEALTLAPDLLSRPALDLGCGRGRMTRELERRGFKSAVAADITGVAVRDAARHAAGGAVADAEAMPFAEASFGLVSELTMLSSIDPSLWPAAAREIGRVVAAGGFYVTEQVKRPAGRPLEERVETACKLPRTLDEVWGFRPEDFERLLGRDFDRLFLAAVPVRDASTDTPSWVGLFQRKE